MSHNLTSGSLTLKDAEGRELSVPFAPGDFRIEPATPPEPPALIRRKLSRGCACGCRGDYEITEAGRAFLASQPPDLAVESA